MKPAEYQRYLASREWAVLKEAVRQRSKGVCERCHFNKHEQTHHLTYERIGREVIDDLLGVCSICHEYLSGKTNLDPVAARPLYWMRRVQEGIKLGECEACECRLAPYSVRLKRIELRLCKSCFNGLAHLFCERLLEIAVHRDVLPLDRWSEFKDLLPQD
jgi:hypothetical protein